MAKSIADIRKKRGRPPTGIGPMIGLRLYPDLEARLDAWIARQSDQPSRPEAIRRLMEIGLSAGGTKIPRIVAPGDATASTRETAAPPRAVGGHTSKSTTATKPAPGKPRQRRS
jgi:hypothetical protein